MLSDAETARAALDGAVAVFTTGAAGIQLVSEEIWSSIPSLKLIADINAVPPLGIGGIDMNDNREERNGRISFGAIGIGGPKMKVHRTCIARLFEAKNVVMDAEEVYAVAKELV